MNLFLFCSSIGGDCARRVLSALGAGRCMFCCALFVATATEMRGQNYVSLLNAPRQMFGVSVGASPHLEVATRYWYSHESLRLSPEIPFGLTTEIGIPLFSQTNGLDARFRVGVACLASFAGEFKAITGLSWTIQRSEDLNARYWTTGLKFDVYPGWYGREWAIAPHIAFDYRPFVHIEHKEYAQQAFQDLYPYTSLPQINAKNGWFLQEFFLTQTGLSVAHFQNRWNVQMTMGFQHHWNNLGIIFLPDIGLMPIYGNLEMNIAL